MGASESGSLPSDLARGRNRFQAWRGQRTGRGRIPRSLWALAVQLAKVHGVSRTAAVLGLDYHSLKKRASEPRGLAGRHHAATGQSKCGERRPRR
jgi:hypothetical protein